VYTCRLAEGNRLSMRISSPTYGDVWSFRPQNQNCILGDRYVNVDNANACSVVPMLVRYSYKLGSYYDSVEATLILFQSINVSCFIFFKNVYIFSTIQYRFFCNFIDLYFTLNFVEICRKILQDSEIYVQ